MNKHIFKDMATYLPAQLIPGIVGFLSLPIITRLFPPSEYGYYVLVWGAMFFSVTIVGWLSMSVVRFYPKCCLNNTLEKFYITVLLISVVILSVFALIFSIALIVAKSKLSPKLTSLMGVGLLAFIFLSLFHVLLEFFRARRQIGFYSGFVIWRSIAGIGFGLGLILIFHLGIEGLLWGNILSLAVAFPLLWKKALGKASLHPRNLSWTITSEMATYGLPLVFGNLASRILYLSDRYILGIFWSSREVGIYSASYDIGDHTIVLITILFALTSGSLAFNIWEREGEQKSREFMSSITRFYLMIGIPCVVGLSVLAKPLISLLTGQQYHQGYRVVPLVVLGAFCFGLQQRFQIGLQFHKNTKAIMFAVFAAAIVNVGLNMILIPRYGYIAAAATTLGSYILLLVLMIVLSRRRFIWKFPFRSLANISLASGFMGAIVFVMGHHIAGPSLVRLVLLVGTGILIYLPGLFLLKEFKLAEIKIVFGWLSRPSKRAI